MPKSLFVPPLRSPALAAVLVAVILAGAPALRAQSAIPANYPAWWHDGLVPGTRIILDDAPHDTAANYAPVNLGQLKWVATRAKNYLDARLAAAGGSGIDLTRLFPPLPPAGDPRRAAAIAANYAPANLGQLKAVAKLFYDRLNQVGYDTHAYLIRRGYPASWAHSQPWLPNTTPEANYAAANIGQLKLVFGFDLSDPFRPSAPIDLNGNGLHDDWEIAQGWSVTAGVIEPGHGMDDDPDGDGLTNAQELDAGTNPNLFSTAGDGVSDAYGLDGAITLETWWNVSDATLAGFMNSTRSGAAPDGVSLVESSEAPQNRGEHFVEQLRGYLTPQVEGDYTFLVSADDEAELWLSTDDNPAHAVKVAFTEQATGYRQWNAFPSQRSATASLRAGVRYYLHAIARESVDSDNLSVAWIAPGATDPEVIGKAFLSGYRPATGAQLNPFLAVWRSANPIGNKDLQADSDGDGIPDTQEIINGTNPNVSDAPQLGFEVLTPFLGTNF